MKKIFIVAMVSMLSLSAFAVSNGVNANLVANKAGAVNLTADKFGASKLAAGKFDANLAAGKFVGNKAGARVEKVEKFYPINDSNKTDYVGH